MRRTTTILATFLLSASLLACGGGGDDEDASSSGSEAEETTTTEEEAADVCDDDVVDALDSFLNDSDVPDFEEADAALEVVADAEPDLEDAVETITDATALAAEALEDVDPDDEDAVNEALNEVFSELDFDEVLDAQQEVAEFVDDECDTELADDSGDDTTTTEGEAEDFTDLVDACEGGDMASCDELFAVTPVGSDEEEIGATCGGLADNPIPGECEATFGEDSGDDGGDDTSLEDFADDVSACSDGDMEACDTLFLETPVGSDAESFGLSCGGRRIDPQPEQSCADEFG